MAKKHKPVKPAFIAGVAVRGKGYQRTDYDEYSVRGRDEGDAFNQVLTQAQRDNPGRHIDIIYIEREDK